MAKTTGEQFVGRIIHAVRLRNSTNGNPRYRLVFATDDGAREHVTKSDASCCYDVENLQRGGGVRVRVQLTRTGRVDTMTPEQA